MRKVILIGALCVFGSLGAMGAMPADTGGPTLTGLVGIESAGAAISRGGGGGGGGGNASQVGEKTAQLLQGWITPLIFVLAAIGIGVAAFQRNAGMAVVVVVLALVIGAFTLVPDQVEAWFRDIYRFVL